jgi:hypothetical protein
VDGKGRSGQEQAEGGDELAHAFDTHGVGETF